MLEVLAEKEGKHHWKRKGTHTPHKHTHTSSLHLLTDYSVIVSVLIRSSLERPRTIFSQRLK